MLATAGLDRRDMEVAATLVNPMDERVPPTVAAPPRLATLRGKRVALLDISKPGGSVFLDRLGALLEQRFGVAEVLRFRKPTFAKPAPEGVLADMRKAQPHAIVEALAD